MDDRRRHRALMRIATIRGAERAATQLAMLLARNNEREAQAAQTSAEEATQAAASAWQEQLSTGGFHPEIAGALAADLNIRVGDAREAQAHASAMTNAREASEADWQLGSARCRQANHIVAASKRAITCGREEQALNALADRVSFDWTRR